MCVVKWHQERPQENKLQGDVVNKQSVRVVLVVYLLLYNRYCYSYMKLPGGGEEQLSDDLMVCGRSSQKCLSSALLYLWTSGCITPPAHPQLQHTGLSCPPVMLCVSCCCPTDRPTGTNSPPQTNTGATEPGQLALRSEGGSVNHQRC